MLIFCWFTHSFLPLAEQTLPLLRRYAMRHGYSLCTRQDDSFPGKFYGFYKADLATHCFVEEQRRGIHQLMWVVDVDVLITNSAVAIHSFMPCDAEIAITRDCHGINGGSYLVSARGIDLMRKLVCSGTSDIGANGEQCVFEQMQQAYPDRIRILDHPSINSYLYGEYGMQRAHGEGQWKPGDLCLHMPGITHARRFEIIREISPQIL